MGIDIGDALSKSANVMQRNPGIIVPALIPAAVSLIFTVIFGSILSKVMMNPAIMMGFLGLTAIYVIVMLILGIIAGGAIVTMAYEELRGGRSDYRTGLSKAVEKLPQLLVASIIMAIGVFIGSLLLVIPGLIFALLVMFTIQEIMIRDRGAIDAISSSIDIVKRNFFDVLLFAIVLFVIVFILSFILNMIPVIGGFISALIITPFVSIATTAAYIQLA